MMEKPASNREQAANWNEGSGRTWVAMQPMLDAMFAPLLPVLVEASAPQAGDCVLDIGCGAGATTFALARRPEVSACLGADISAPLVERARERAAEFGLSNVDFCIADAQTHAFEASSFDVATSRFGVMFFDDPVAAFANIRRALRKDGRLAVLAWRSPRDNPFMTAAARAARPYLPDLPRFEPNAPGQFGFADDAYVREILDGSGWGAVHIDPVDVECAMPTTDLEPYIMNMGPVGAALRNGDPAQRETVAAVVRAAFDPFVAGDEVHFPIACWLVRATA